MGYRPKPAKEEFVNNNFNETTYTSTYIGIVLIILFGIFFYSMIKK